MKNRISGLLMETGVSYNKQRLHKVGYFRELMSTNQEIKDSVRPLLKLCREHYRSLTEDRMHWYGRWSAIRCWPSG